MPAPFRLTAAEQAATSSDVPGLEITAWGGSGRTSRTRRVDLNRWLVTIGPEADAVGDEVMRRHARSLPSTILDELAVSCHGELVQLSIELDSCGAWITVGNAGACRPVTLRRAGWVDLRGHPTPALGTGFNRYRDDRVGLGPGDALVLVPPEHRAALSSLPQAPSELEVDDVVLEVLLQLNLGPSPPDAPAVAGALGSPVPPPEPVVPLVVIAVPADLGADRHGDLAEALGVAPEELELPGYPLGDLQPDLWSEPPRPPRTALLHLRAGSARLEEVRTLLTRMLASWRLEGRVAAHDVTLLATEIVSNALRHAGTDSILALRYTGSTVEVSVRDGSHQVPLLSASQGRQSGGRGMFLVDSLAQAWGIKQLRGGKLVWFEVPVTTPAP